MEFYYLHPTTTRSVRVILVHVLDVSVYYHVLKSFGAAWGLPASRSSGLLYSTPHACPVVFAYERS